ncbi:hypothetical protein ACLQ2R_37120 [Streptosporangium sp. DT93]|uniref:hypothetical protein n=1 Tax=Streptosporangium sp. DT93 TaxID=3393428 RepID=UPI003CF59AA0
MQRERLIIAGPLIAALVFGTVGISQASAGPASVRDGRVAATSKVAPPVCTRAFNGELRELCSRGWSDGYADGYATCGKTSQQQKGYSTSPELQDAAYVHGYNDGFQAGMSAC